MESTLCDKGTTERRGRSKSCGGASLLLKILSNFSWKRDLDGIGQSTHGIDIASVRPFGSIDVLRMSCQQIASEALEWNPLFVTKAPEKDAVEASLAEAPVFS